MKRSDGTRLTSLDPFVEMIPYIMERRSDAQNFAKRIFSQNRLTAISWKRKRKGVSFAISIYSLQPLFECWPNVRS